MQERSPTSWFAGSLRVGDETTPANAVLEAFKASGPQLRLWQSAPDYADFTVNGSGNLTLGVSGTKFILDAGTYFQVDHSNNTTTSQQMLWFKSSSNVVISRTTAGTETAFATNGYIAVKFNSGSDVVIRGLTVKLRKDVSVNPLATVRALIYTDNSGSPGTSLAVSVWPIYASTLTTSIASYDFMLEQSTLTASTDYWLVLQVVGQTAGTLYVGDLSVQATPLYATSSNGSSWTTWNNSFYFQLRTIPHLPITGESDFREGVRAISNNYYAGYFNSTRGISIAGVGYVGGAVIGALRGYGAYIYSTYSYAGYFIQQGTLDTDVANPVLFVRRSLSLSGNTATGALVDIDDLSGSTGNLFTAKQNGTNRFLVTYDGKVAINNISVGSYNLAVNGTSYFQGALTVGGSSVGYSTIQAGNASNPGYIEFRTSDNTRRGYIGWNDGSSRLLLAAENSWVWSFNSVPYVGSNQMWHAGNDGASSGLDADLLDGQQGTYYLNTSSGAQTKSGDLTVNLLTSTTRLVASAGVAFGSMPANALAVGDAFFATSVSYINQALRLGGALYIHNSATQTLHHYLESHASGYMYLVGVNGQLNEFRSGNSRFGYTTVGFVGTATNNTFYVQTNNTNRIEILGGGRIGLGGSAHGTYDVYVTGSLGVSTFTTGSVLFASSNQVTQDNTNFFWDNTNKGLRIGARPLITAANHAKSIFVASANGQSNDFAFIQNLQTTIGMQDGVGALLGGFVHNLLAFWAERGHTVSTSNSGGSFSSIAEAYSPSPTVWNYGFRHWGGLVNNTGSTHTFTIEFTTADVNTLASFTAYSYFMPYVVFRNVGNMPTNIKVEMRFNDNNTYATWFDGTPTFIADMWRAQARQSPGGSYAMTGIKYTFTVASNASPCEIMEIGLTSNWRNPMGSLLYASPFASQTWTQSQTFNGGTTTFSNGTSNLLLYNNNGLGAPTFTSRSAGTKITLYNSLTGSAADYALGMESSSMWFSVANNSSTFFHWYGGTTRMMTLTASNLGLGTAAPTTASGTGKAIEIEDTAVSEFHAFRSSGSVSAYLGSSSQGGYTGTHSNHEFRVRTNGSDRMFFAAAGNIGVNTLSPQGAFHIDGALHFTEQASDPSASNLTSSTLYNYKDRMSIYMKNDKFCIAFNNSGVVTYITIPLNGSTTTWTQSTTAP